MAIGTGSSLSSVFNRNQDNALKDLGNSFKKLSSGLRINQASDDAAGLAIAAGLGASVVSLGQASRNVGDYVSASQIADGALGQIGDLSSRLQELAAQSANGTYSDGDRASLQNEYSQLTQEITRIAQTTQFNGVSLLQGNTSTAQIGTDGSTDSQLTPPATDVSSLIASLSSQNIGTQAGAQNAIDAIQTFSQSVSDQRGNVGATQARLDSVASTIESRKLNETAARARITDLDYADEISKSTAASIRSQVGPALQAQAGKLNSDIVARLLA